MPIAIELLWGVRGRNSMLAGVAEERLTLAEARKRYPHPTARLESGEPDVDPVAAIRDGWTITNDFTEGCETYFVRPLQ